MLRFWLAILTVVLAAGSALAQTPPSSVEMLEQFVRSPAYRERITSAAQAQHKTIGNTCAATRYEVPERLVPVAPVSMGADGTPAEGAWIQEVDSAGCGKALRLRILVAYFSGQAPRYSPIFPGETKTGLVLGFDTYKLIVPVLDAQFGKCPDLAMVIDTRFEAFTGPPVPDALHAGQRPWRESWVFSHCQGRFKVKVRFLPDKTGTGIGLDAKGITKLK